VEPRLAKALHIAATTSLAPNNGRWKVPSQSGNGNYTVTVTSDGSWFCSCPDHDETLAPCKHIMAVETTIQRETGKAACEFSEVVKMTYSQNWTAYNAAQCNEKEQFLKLLFDLCAGIEQPAGATTGRPRLPLADMVFSVVQKAYVGSSARRLSCDLRDAKERGFIDSAPSFNSVLNYQRDAALTQVLVDLVELSALPLRAVETDFAVDSSGFGTRNIKTWYSTKHGRDIESRDWRKVHAMAGVRTHIVTALQVSGAHANDAPFLPALAKTTAKNFTMTDVCADKGCLTKNNAAEIEALGATPFIPFKSNSVKPPEGSAWARMWHMFEYRREEFLARYHKRSNVETVFAMVKAKFGDELHARTAEGQDNEVLAKFVAHNLCVLIQAFYELGIEADFRVA
jgi:transposase